MSKPRFDPNQPFEAVDESSVVQKPKFDPSAPFEATDSEVSPTASALRGAASGASFGFDDEIIGALNAAGGSVGLPNLGSGKSLSETFTTDTPTGFDAAAFLENYQKGRDVARQGKLTDKAINPKATLAGELAGGLATTALPGIGVLTAAGKGATFGSTVGKSALSGALSGAGGSEPSSAADLARDVALGAGIGGTLGAGGYGIGKGLEKAFGLGGKVIKPGTDAAANKASDIAENLSARALGAERGTIRKFGQEKVKEAGRYGLDTGVVKPFRSPESLIDANEIIKEKAGKQLGGIYDTLDELTAPSFNPGQVAEKVNEKIGNFWRSPLNKAETKQFDNTIEAILQRGDIEMFSPEGKRILLRGAKNISLRDAQALKQELGTVANWKNVISVTDKERMARDAYKVVNEAISDAADRSAKTIGIDNVSNLLEKANKIYSTSITAGEMLKNKQAREAGNRLFGLTDQIAAAGGLAAGGFGTAGLVGLGKKAVDKYGITTSAYAIDKLSKLIRNSPEKLGKFGETLKNAATRGGQALAATHHMLLKNPEYKDSIGSTLQEEPKNQGPSIGTETVDSVAPKMGKYAPVLLEANARGPKALAVTNYMLQSMDPEYQRQMIEMQNDDE